MAEALPKKWCASFHTNSITLKKMTAANVRWPRGSYHDTWEEAHVSLVLRRAEEFKKAEREFQRARTAVLKAQRMTAPQAPAGDGGGEG